MKTQDKTTSRQTVKTKMAKTIKNRAKIPVRKRIVRLRPHGCGLEDVQMSEVEVYTVEEFFNLGSDNQGKAKPVGWSSNPDDFGPMIVDSKTFEKLCGGK
jgi:hypothetical protein